MSTCNNCVWEEFSAPLKVFIRKRVVNEQDAEDIYQEIFIKIHKNIDSVMDVNKIQAWIYRIARNSITDNYRKNQNNGKVTELTEDLESVSEEELSSNSEIASCLKVMVDSLPEIRRGNIIDYKHKNSECKFC